MQRRILFLVSNDKTNYQASFETQKLFLVTLVQFFSKYVIHSKTEGIRS